MNINYFRDSNDTCLYDEREIWDLEIQDLALQCPYRQMLIDTQFYRSPQNPQNQPPNAPPNFIPQNQPPNAPPNFNPQNQPPNAPPDFIPQQQQAQQFGATPYVEQETIRHCVYRYVYIWPRRGNGFWAWLTYVGRSSVSGYRWNRNTWRYFGMNLREIRSFECF